MNQRPDPRTTSFGYRFAMLHRLHMALCREDILRQGVRPGQLPFLLSLVREPSPVTQDYLADCLAIDKGVTARALGHLEKNGFVVRETNPDNRRQNLVSATKKAHAAADTLIAALARASEVFVQGFTEEEKSSVLDLLDRMLLNARQAADRK